MILYYAATMIQALRDLIEDVRAGRSPQSPLPWNNEDAIEARE
jgi:hypothetical protein